MKNLAKALSLFQGEVKDAHKDSTNPFFHSKYASLESVLNTVRPLLAKHGLCVVQLTEHSLEHKTTVLRTTVMHESGESISGTYPIYGKDNSPQATGSAISYAKRYALQAALLISSEDDDSEAAEARQPSPQTAKPAKSVSDAQLKRLFAICKASGWSKDDAKDYLHKLGLESASELNYMQYEHMCKTIGSTKKEG